MKLNIKGKDIEVNEDKLIELIKREGLEVKSGGFEINQKYWSVDHNLDEVYGIKYTADKLDLNRIALGNAFTSEELAEQALERRKAIVRLWNWAKENAPFEPDWSNEEQYKCFSRYDYDNKKLECDYYIQVKIQTELPYFATSDDVERFNSECREDLLRVNNVK